MKKKNKKLLLFSSAIVIIILLLIFGFNVLQTEFVVYNNYNKNFTFQNIDFTANSNQDFIPYSYSSNPRYGDVCTTNTLNTIDSSSVLDIKLLRSQSKACEEPEPISTSIQSTNLKLVPSELKILRLNGYIYSSCSNNCDEVVRVYLVDENGNYKLLLKSEAQDLIEDYVYDLTLERLKKRIDHYYRDNSFRKGISKIVSRLNKIINRKIRQLRRRR